MVGVCMQFLRVYTYVIVGVFFAISIKYCPFLPSFLPSFEIRRHRHRHRPQTHSDKNQTQTPTDSDRQTRFRQTRIRLRRLCSPPAMASAPQSKADDTEDASTLAPSSSSSSSSAISSSQTTPTDDGSAVASKLDSLAVSDASTPSDDIDTPQISLKSEVLDEETEAAEPSQIKTVCLPLFSFPHMRTARFYPPGKMVYA